ncbi:acyl-CoA thioesterase [uncultured Cohaesibacter sp.]|uniref:acyl-CoA thioesterase n=1 Tax=uncultured Cohaesibacter sp. TaxID=1002546 RepID=UPI002930D211|nr:acyl-CoA thioesterase [uncultured Cohaesibacter sp.]
MAADTNPAGDIFGGWLMSQMDLAAGNMAARVALGRVTTVAVEGMQFHHPVNVGDEVTIYGSINRLGRTSIRLHVKAWSRANFIEKAVLVTEADFVCVALDDEGKPRPVKQGRE